jgi:hypothetical protein
MKRRKNKTSETPITITVSFTTTAEQLNNAINDTLNQLGLMQVLDRPTKKNWSKKTNV